MLLMHSRRLWNYHKFLDSTLTEHAEASTIGTLNRTPKSPCETSKIWFAVHPLIFTHALLYNHPIRPLTESCLRKLSEQQHIYISQLKWVTHWNLLVDRSWSVHSDGIVGAAVDTLQFTRWTDKNCGATSSSASWPFHSSYATRGHSRSTIQVSDL